MGLLQGPMGGMFLMSEAPLNIALLSADGSLLLCEDQLGLWGLWDAREAVGAW